MKKLLVVLLLSATSLMATDSSQEIRVQLSTANPLQPIYMGKIQAQQAVFDTSYLSQLESILSYDFNYNSSTKVQPRSSEKEQLLNNKDQQVAFNGAVWKGWGISFAIRWELNGKLLKASSFNAQQGMLKTFPAVTLTGNLNEDRKQLHKLSDGIYKALFNQDGVASTRLLFAYQIRNPKPDGSEWISEIWECDWDGANAHQITHEENYCVTGQRSGNTYKIGNKVKIIVKRANLSRKQLDFVLAE